VPEILIRALRKFAAGSPNSAYATNGGGSLVIQRGRKAGNVSQSSGKNQEGFTKQGY
jgi:hypothetical protein